MNLFLLLEFQLMKLTKFYETLITNISTIDLN